MTSVSLANGVSCLIQLHVDYMNLISFLFKSCLHLEDKLLFTKMHIIQTSKDT